MYPITQKHLEHPIWDVLQVNTNFTMIVRTCIETYQSKEEDFEEYQYPKAVGRGMGPPIPSR